MLHPAVVVGEPLRETLASTVSAVLEVGLGASASSEPLRLRVAESFDLPASDLASPVSEKLCSLGEGEIDRPIVARKAAIDSLRSREPQLPDGWRVRPSGNRPGIGGDTEPVLLAAPLLPTLPTRLRPVEARLALPLAGAAEDGSSKSEPAVFARRPSAPVGAAGAEAVWW